MTKTETLVREILERVADKWTWLVLEALEADGALRFSQLRQRVGGVSQKMLTKTLRQLERDGLVTRKVFPEVPPRVEYKLTRLGETLSESFCPVWIWVEKHAREMERARQSYDAASGGARRRAAARAADSAR